MRLLASVFIFAVLLSVSAMAQTAACKADIEKCCAGVEPAAGSHRR